MYRDDIAKIAAKAYRQGFKAGYKTGHRDGFDECARDNDCPERDIYWDDKTPEPDPNEIQDACAAGTTERFVNGIRVRVTQDGAYIIDPDGTSRPLGTHKGVREL